MLGNFFNWLSAGIALVSLFLYAFIYTPLKKVPDAMIRKVGITRFADDKSNVAFLEGKKDASATSLKKKLVAKSWGRRHCDRCFFR